MLLALLVLVGRLTEQFVVLAWFGFLGCDRNQLLAPELAIRAVVSWLR